jgi:hypothetical protein
MVRSGAFATGSSQQEVRPCPLCPESGSNFRALAAPRRAVAFAHKACRANQQISVQPFLEKYSAFTLAKINSISAAVSSPEGRLAIVTDAGRDAVDATASARNRGRRAVLRAREQLTACRRTAVLRTAKSCGPDAPTLASSFAETPFAQPGVTRQYPQGDGGKKARSPGRARSKPLNHCAGKAGLNR